jgi:hypothetical protein
MTLPGVSLVGRADPGLFSGCPFWALNCLIEPGGKLLVIILARNLQVRFDKYVIKNDISKSLVHGVVHGQSYINS